MRLSIRCRIRQTIWQIFDAPPYFSFSAYDEKIKTATRTGRCKAAAYTTAIKPAANAMTAAARQQRPATKETKPKAKTPASPLLPPPQTARCKRRRSISLCLSSLVSQAAFEYCLRRSSHQDVLPIFDKQRPPGQVHPYRQPAVQQPPPDARHRRRASPRAASPRFARTALVNAQTDVVWAGNLHEADIYPLGKLFVPFQFRPQCADRRAIDVFS